MITVDGRCHCARCKARTEDIYRMVGVCLNCGTKDILILFRAGDPATHQDCPVCRNYRKVMPQRLATLEEVPAAVPQEPGKQPKEPPCPT